MNSSGLPEGFTLDAAQPAQDQNGLPSGFQLDDEKYGTPLETLKAGAEGVAQGFLGPVAPAVETGLGISTKEAIKGREKANPWTHGLSEAGGFIGGALTGTGEAALLAKAGEAGSSALRLGGEGAGLVNRIGSAAVKGAIENSLFSAGDIGSQIVLGRDPGEAMQTALPYLGLSAIIGGAAGSALGGVGELWKSRYGEEAGSVLRALTNKLGGNVAEIDDPIARSMETVGIDPKPEVLAAMSSDPSIQTMAKALEQSDATSSGHAYQQALKEFHFSAQDAIASAFGKTPKELENLPEVSKYEAGKKIGETLASEYQTKLDPISKEFEELKGKYKDAPLSSDFSIPGQYQAEIIPGTASKITEKLGQLAEKEGWVGADNEISKELKRVLKVVPQKQTLGDLTQLITQVGNSTRSTLPFGMQTPLSRAGQLIKNVLRDAEDEVAIQHLGSEAPELVERFSAAREGYKDQAKLQEALNDRLKIGGSVSGFSKGLKEMAATDGESLLRKISGTGDANLLSFLSENFPKTAEAVKDYHLSNVLENAVNRAKPEEKLNLAALQKSVNKMSPELRGFVLSPDQMNKLEGMQILQDRLNRVPHNFSNTARTNAMLNKYGIGSAIGLASVLTGHGPVMGVALGALGHFLSKTAPDAARLGLLKFIGSEKSINSAALKSAVNFIHAAQKGDNLLKNGAKAIFNAESKVIPEQFIPDEKSRYKLQESLQKYGSSSIGSNLGHYLPDHAASAQSTVQSASAYLSAIAPKETQGLPFDKPNTINKFQKNSYDRSLDLVEQPLLIFQHLKNGTVLPQDVQAVKAVYPALYQKMSKMVQSQMLQEISDGKDISYQQRLNISAFLGMPLDYTMTPQSMQAIIHSSVPPPQPEMSKTRGGSNKISGTALNQINKVSKMYQTPSQSNAARRSE